MLNRAHAAILIRVELLSLEAQEYLWFQDCLAAKEYLLMASMARG
jgi:hypothetical protein